MFLLGSHNAFLKNFCAKCKKCAETEIAMEVLFSTASPCHLINAVPLQPLQATKNRHETGRRRALNLTQKAKSNQHNSFSMLYSRPTSAYI